MPSNNNNGQQYNEFQLEQYIKPGFVMKDSSGYQSYEIEKFIADNSVHTVRAKHLSSGKIFVLQFQESLEKRDEFSEIVDVMIKLPHHPGIASVIARGEYLIPEFDNKPIPYTVNEFVHGKRATKYFFKDDKPKTVEKLIQCMKIGISLLEVVTFLDSEASGRLSFNVDKSNVLLTNDGQIKIAELKLLSSKERKCNYIKIHLEKIQPMIQNICSGLSPDREFFNGKSFVNISEFEKELETIKDKLKNELQQEHVSIARSSLEEPIQKDLYRKISGIPTKVKGDINKIVHELAQTKIERVTDGREIMLTSVKQSITNLVNHPRLLNILQSNEKRWYATVLIRYPESAERNLSGQLAPIFMAEYRGDSMTAQSDWISDYKTLNPVIVDKSCAGLPIVWYEKNVRDTLREEHNILIHLNPDSSNCIRYCIIKKIKDVVFDNFDEASMVYQLYKGDRQIGWNLTSLLGTKVEMSRKIQTEIVIPIYDPVNRKIGSPEQIIAVANFEWEEEFPIEKAQYLAEELAKFIQDNNGLAVNRVMSHMLKSIQLPQRSMVA
jgi:ABC-type arginine transport system ATPase subunit